MLNLDIYNKEILLSRKDIKKFNSLAENEKIFYNHGVQTYRIYTGLKI
jgi:hypothetical protein